MSTLSRKCIICFWSVLSTVTCFSQNTQKIVIFGKNDTIQNWTINEKFERFTPSKREVEITDSLTLNYIRHNRSMYYWTQEITDLKNYYRQYIGIIDQNVHAVILLNCFCNYRENWKEQIVAASGGGSCYFEIKVDLQTNHCRDFLVNAPK